MLKTHIFLKDTQDNPNLMVPWYLMASYAYYQEDDPILTDHMFDELAKNILEKWYDITHYHKHLLTIDDLKAGSYLGEYPERVKGGLKHVRSMR